MTLYPLSDNETRQAREWWGDYVVNNSDLFMPYWTLYPPPSTRVYHFLGILVAFIAILGVLGNGAVIYAFMASSTLRRQKLFTVNLSLSDFLSCGLTYHMFVVSSFKEHWAFSKDTCTYYAFSQGVYGFVSICSLAAIALERYAAIARQSSRWNNLSYPYKILICAVIWGYCAMVCSGPMYGMGDYAAAGFLNTCCFDYINRHWRTRLFIFFLFVFGFFVPCAVICYCYYYIYKATVEAAKMLQIRMEAKEDETLQLRAKALAEIQGTVPQQVGFLSPNDGTDGASSTGRSSRLSTSSALSFASDTSFANAPALLRIKGKDIRSAKLCILVVAVFCLAWTPYAVAALLGQFGPKRIVHPWMSMVPSLIAKSSTLYNPFLYLYKDTRFQRAFQKYVLGKELKRGTKTDSMSTQQQEPLPKSPKPPTK